MVMIPVVPAPSRRTRELKERLEQAIRDYERDHPNLTPGEVQHALQIMAAGGARRTDRRAGAVIAALVAVFIALGAVLADRSAAGGEAAETPWVPVVVGVAVAVLMAIVAFTRMNRE